jgi:hypothetical protein
MTDDCNLTLHTRNESLADATYSRIVEHPAIMDALPADLEDTMSPLWSACRKSGEMSDW